MLRNWIKSSLDGLWLRDLFASDGYIVHSEMGKDQTLEFIEV